MWLWIKAALWPQFKRVVQHLVMTKKLQACYSPHENIARGDNYKLPANLSGEDKKSETIMPLIFTLNHNHNDQD